MNYRPYKGKIGNKLVITFVLFVTIFVGITGWFLYQTTKNSLDRELGEKLVAIAQSVTTQIDGIFLLQLSPGDESGRNYANLLNKIKKVKEATGVKRVYIFDRENQSLVDTEPDVPIGTEYIKLRFDRTELKALWSGESVYTVLFTGDDGIYYKSGYAPITANGQITAAVGVDTSANFIQTIRSFRRSVIIFAFVSVLMTIAIGFLFARTITSPIHKLVRFADGIGKGDLDSEIHIESNDELGYLGHAMENMRKGIIERDKQLRMMLAGVAHEIRNPLGGIGIFAELLSDELEGESREHTQKIIKEVRNLNGIISQFLEYARPKDQNPEVVTIGSVMDEAYFLLSIEYDKSDVVFRNDMECENALVYVDPEQMKRVFINILKNAFQVLNGEGQITLKGQIRENYVDIEITDTGPGIPPGNLENIFDPFFTTKEKGVGLGLSIVKRTVEANGGRISVESEVGKYTTFTVSLPLSSQSGETK
ncbi:HAMP domain-containing protein [Candidatus Poribacteria bacterium]|nr:HAMP domain-containing protein [Candidatus Poribacteria bacterium]